MADGDPALPSRVGLVGAGVIGGGWAARFVLAGVDVRLFDPSPAAAEAVTATVERARHAWGALVAAPLPPEGILEIVDSVEAAVDGVGLVQESAPEREELKAGLLAQASRAAPSDALIATSTSGLLPSRLAAQMTRPERFVVGHPFNPVYLLPLVEVCGCDRTAPETVARAAELYRGVGMRPLIVRREIDGFIADRLLEALWREALWLVADDVATVEEVDDAIRFGAGLRWSAMGTFLTYRLAGGAAGMRHFMAQFGPALQLPWTRLTDVPDLDDALIDKIVAQSDAQAAGLSVDELARLRDDCLVAVLHGLASTGFGAGEVVAQTERALWQRAAATDGAAASLGADLTPAADPPRAADLTSAADSPGAADPPRAADPPHAADLTSATDPTPAADARLWLHQVRVDPEWIDYNGHMTEARYLQVLADASDAFLAHIGVLGPYLDSGRSYYTVESHLRHLGEAHLGDRLSVATRLLSHDAKRLHLFHELVREADGTLVATGEHMLLHVDRAAGRTVPAGEEILAALARIADRQRDLPWPEGAGNRIRGPRVEAV